MAFLLLLHEKMRLKRKVNTMTLRQVRVSHRKERMTKKIAQVQKMYANRLTQLEKQASIWTKQAQMSIYNGFGLGCQNQMFNPMSGGMTSFVYGMMQSAFKSDAFKKEHGELDFEKMMTDYGTTGLKQKTDKDGKPIEGKYGDNEYTKEQVEAFQKAMMASQQMQSQAQFQAQQMASMYESNVSVWIEAERMRIEEEQEEMLLPLQAEEEDLDLENESLEAQLQDARARLESLEQACSQEIKDSVPKFGLG